MPTGVLYGKDGEVEGDVLGCGRGFGTFVGKQDGGVGDG